MLFFQPGKVNTLSAARAANFTSCLIVKFVDDTAVVGRIANNDESDYRQETPPSPCTSEGLRWKWSPASGTWAYTSLTTLTWSKNTSCLIRKAHQRLYFLRRLRRAGLGSSVLTSFYRCVVESVLSSCIIVWHGSCSAAEKKALQRVVKAAQRTVGRSLPTTMDIYTSRCRKWASCIMKDPTHTAHRQEAAEH
ncbi:hypothetical protein L3Q82_020886 [Scortum barcoo]|uniref:Uncharacterized protein n=1 Tax=Scortum barcoo TaxID=214431 RepID=A0ACB8V8V5_9TELE|nr:hypothetical protein L3Q82_020886 [Scortum barcoo]